MKTTRYSDMNWPHRFLEGFEWPVSSSRGDKSYTVTITNFGFSCSCPAGSFRGRCKHMDQVHDLIVNDDDEV